MRKLVILKRRDFPVDSENQRGRNDQFTPCRVGKIYRKALPAVYCSIS